MINNKQIIEQIKIDGLMPLFYHDDETTCVSIIRALDKGGSRIIEFTNRGKNVLQNFKALVAERNNRMPGLLLAIGTIHTADEAAVEPSDYREIKSDYEEKISRLEAKISAVSNNIENIEPLLNKGIE